ncbi:FAD-binding oxidoreductase [Roseomonas sp. OT10]|uniref:FAD-binding oxidoreductase n=1 Tax=Roseomonas cutis TaxID=2897332 RepID=UPI001E52A3FF|nr:FAD-binding oxidoreductase [Roseomonas sp. OT10]UFN51112.1 FAD-binding oxidoreductase [Roseomonas sp. OT10]
MSVAAAMADLPGIEWLTDPALVRQKSRDFFWYSPVLRRQLNRVTGEAVAVPKDEREVADLLAAAWRHDVPVTARGAGTGNYGQAMPLRGGIVLDLSAMDRVLWTKPHAVRVQPGARLIDLDAATRAAVGGELRFHPSTKRTATIGGFVAGGSSGIGSVTWGTLREAGNILGLRVLTCEAEPRALELRGPEIQQVNHAYGTNGIITELEMPLAPAAEWIDLAAAFPTLMQAARFADAFTRLDGVVKKLACVVGAPIPQDHFRNLGAAVPAGHSVALLMVAAPFLDDVLPLLAPFGGALLRQVPTEEAEVPLYEHSWNHTTLQVLKTDRSVTYLQTLCPAPDHLARIAALEARFGDEVPLHLEFVRLGGEVCAFALQLVRFSGEERLAEIIAGVEAEGCPVFDPHAFTLEAGGMKRVDEAQLRFKRMTDPKGLLNPGKMAAWDDPEWRPGRPQAIHLFETNLPAPAEEPG